MSSAKVLLYRTCCEELEFALKHGFLIIDELYGEIAFPRASLTAEMSVGNVLTGETYEKKNYSYSLGLFYCPFCGQDLQRSIH